MAQFTRKYTVHNAAPGLTRTPAMVDGHPAIIETETVTVELIPERIADGTLKVVLYGNERSLAPKLVAEKTVVEVSFSFPG